MKNAVVTKSQTDDCDVDSFVAHNTWLPNIPSLLIGKDTYTRKTTDTYQGTVANLKINEILRIKP